MSDQSRLEIVIDSRSGEQNVRRVRNELEGLESTGVRSLGSVRQAATMLTGALAAIGVTTGIANSVRQVADFQAAINGLAAVSNATAQDMARLEQQARTLGATSQFSAQQSAEAQRFLAQAGFDANQVLAATPGILQLATAGSLDLANAADIASNVLGGMRLEVAELGRVNDVLAATAARSNTSIEQLGQALSFAAPFAASAGIELEEVAAAIGVMSDAGIQASRAGTGMVGVIRQLSRVTPAAERALNAAGLSIDQVNIGALGLETVLDNLRSANLDTAAAIEIFGSEAGAAAQVLISDYKGAISEADGEAERMANTLDRGLIPAFRSLGSAISESTLQMGDSGLAGSLERTVRGATAVISVWNGMSNEFREANGVSAEYMQTAEGVARAVEVVAVLVGTRLVTALGAAAAAKLRAAAAATTLRTALSLLGGPIGILVGSAGLLYTFRRELGLVDTAAEEAAAELDALTEATNNLTQAQIENNRATIENNLNEMREQARALREEIQGIRVDPQQMAATGAGFAENQRRTELMQQANALDERIAAQESGLERLASHEEQLGQTLGAAGGADDALTRLGSTADSLVEKFKPMLDEDIENILDRAGPGARIDEEGQLRDAWWNTLPTLQRELEAQLQDQLRAFESEQNLMRGLEAAVSSFTEKASEAVNQAWANAPGLLPTNEQDGAPALAQPRSVGSLTFKLEGPNGARETEVEGDADDLRRLADLFSGVAAAV